MHPIQFDAFGEPITQVASQTRSCVASKVALRSGISLFWLLVVGVVSARAVYFDPDFAEKFASVAALMKHLQMIVGA